MLTESKDIRKKYLANWDTGDFIKMLTDIAINNPEINTVNLALMATDIMRSHNLKEEQRPNAVKSLQEIIDYGRDKYQIEPARWAYGLVPMAISSLWQILDNRVNITRS